MDASCATEIKPTDESLILKCILVLRALNLRDEFDPQCDPSLSKKQISYGYFGHALYVLLRQGKHNLFTLSLSLSQLMIICSHVDIIHGFNSVL